MAETFEGEIMLVRNDGNTCSDCSTCGGLLTVIYLDWGTGHMSCNSCILNMLDFFSSKSPRELVKELLNETRKS